jgi:heme oxygenase (biliverdin-producing, ferredoxin)
MEKRKMSLKDITWDLHEKAEKNKFAQLLLSGNINKHQYASYLSNLWLIYSVLEKVADSQNVLEGIEGIKKADAIRADIEELGVENDTLVVATTTFMYINHLSELSDNVLAHIYTRHFGDLYGGQILKSRVPGSGSMYEFEDRKGLIEKTRAKLTDDLGPEARVAFEFAISLFEDLTDEFNL